MKISIITVTYNSVSTLKNTLNSLYNQKYKNYEHIIIDGASNDGTIDIINNNKRSFTNFISEPDAGIYDALNKGINIAKGDVIGILHADDYYYDNNVLSKVSKLFSNANIDGVYGDLEYIDKSGETIRKWNSCSFKKELLFEGWMPPHPTLFVKKKIFDEKGGFNINYSISSDYDFIIKIFKEQCYNFSYLPSVITKMTIGGESNKSLANIKRKMSEDYKIIKKHKIGGLMTLFKKNFSKIKQLF